MMAGTVDMKEARDSDNRLINDFGTLTRLLGERLAKNNREMRFFRRRCGPTDRSTDGPMDRGPEM